MMGFQKRTLLSLVGLLWTLSACVGGGGPQGDLAGQGGIGSVGGPAQSLSQDASSSEDGSDGQSGTQTANAPLNPGLPGVGFDPSGSSLSASAQIKPKVFNEEKRIYTALPSGELKTEIIGHLYQLGGAQGSLESCCSAYWVFAYDSFHDTCELTQAGEGGAVQVSLISPAQEYPSISIRILAPEDLEDASKIPDDIKKCEKFQSRYFSLGLLFRYLLEWNSCSATLPAPGTPIDLPENQAWTANYCEAPSLASPQIYRGPPPISPIRAFQSFVGPKAESDDEE